MLPLQPGENDIAVPGRARPRTAERSRRQQPVFAFAERKRSGGSKKRRNAVGWGEGLLAIFLLQPSSLGIRATRGEPGRSGANR